MTKNRKIIISVVIAVAVVALAALALIPLLSNNDADTDADSASDSAAAPTEASDFAGVFVSAADDIPGVVFTDLEGELEVLDITTWRGYLEGIIPETDPASCAGVVSSALLLTASEAEGTAEGAGSVVVDGEPFDHEELEYGGYQTLRQFASEDEAATFYADTVELLDECPTFTSTYTTDLSEDEIMLEDEEALLDDEEVEVEADAEAESTDEEADSSEDEIYTEEIDIAAEQVDLTLGIEPAYHVLSIAEQDFPETAQYYLLMHSGDIVASMEINVVAEDGIDIAVVEPLFTAFASKIAAL